MSHPIDGLVAAFAYNQAKNTGYNQGYNAGYNDCYAKARVWCQESYNNGWQAGDAHGWDRAVIECNKIIEECNSIIEKRNDEIVKLKSLLITHGVKY